VEGKESVRYTPVELHEALLQSLQFVGVDCIHHAQAPTKTHTTHEAAVSS